MDQQQELTFVFDSGSPVSAVSPAVRDRLELLGLLEQIPNERWYRLSPVIADRQPLPDLEVRVLPRLGRLPIHGLIGLNYMRHFESIHVHIPTLTITLQLPN